MQIEGYQAFIPNPLPPSPEIVIDHVQEITKLSYPNANTLVKDFCDLGLLEEITGQKRNRAFSYAPYLEIFKD